MRRLNVRRFLRPAPASSRCARSAWRSSSPATASGRRRAEQPFEHIRRYDVDVTIERSGSVLIKESIAWDFGATTHHGILRDIQTRFRYDDQKKGYDRLTPLEVLSVQASGGASAQYTVEKSGDNRDHQDR